jgi:hypothetical protein
MRVVHLKPLWHESDSAAWCAKPLNKNHYAECVRDEAIVFRDDGGVLFKVLRNRLPFDLCARAFPVLRTAHQNAAFRILASGHAKPGENGISDVLGFMDGTERYGLVQCRRTAWSVAHFLDQEKDIMPLVCAVDDVFREEMPGRHAVQLAQVMKTHPAWRLKSKGRTTAFTTLTINKNMRTFAHFDEGDLKEGFGVITVMKAGKFTGGELIFPRWNISVDVNTTDVLLCDFHELHGNAPLVGEKGKFLRLSCVYYFRTGILSCGSPAQEIERVEAHEMERVRKRVAARKKEQSKAIQPVTAAPAPDPTMCIEPRSLPKPTTPPTPRRPIIFGDGDEELL